MGIVLTGDGRSPFGQVYHITGILNETKVILLNDREKKK